MQTKKIVILGGGGHAKVLIDSILYTGIYQIEGVLDPRLKPGERILGVPVIGKDAYLDRESGKNFCLAIGIGSTEATDKRKLLYEKYKNRYEFAALIDKRSQLAKSIKYGRGIQIIAQAIIRPDVVIGDNVIINTAAIIEHDCRIASHTHISVNAVLGGGARIGECSHVGMGARILQKIKIGNFVTVGAGAVVTEDVGDGLTVCGVPARPIRNKVRA